MIHNPDTATRTRHQASAVASNRRRALRHRATLHGFAWHGPTGTYPVEVTEHRQRVPFTGPLAPRPLGHDVPLVPVAPPAVIGGAPDPLRTRSQGHSPVESPTWGPMVESFHLERERLHSYCAAWLATPEGADEYAALMLSHVEVMILADRERHAERKRRNREQATRRKREQRKREATGETAPLTADEWALAHGVVLPDVGGHHSAVEVSRENRRERIAPRVPAVDLYGHRL